MAQFFRSFADDTLGTLPSDFTAHGEDTFRISAAWGGSGELALGDTAINADKIVTLNNSSTSGVCEVVTKGCLLYDNVYASRIHGGPVLFFNLIGGTSWTGYKCVLRSSSYRRISIIRLNGNGSTTTLISGTDALVSWNTPLYIRFRIDNGVLTAKKWMEGDSEPVDWELTYTDSTYTSGSVGLSSNQLQRFGAFNLGWATDGDPAPTGPVGGGPTARRRSPLIWTPW